MTNLKEALTRKRVFQWEAARQIGINETRLSRIITGRIEATAKEKKALARLVGQTVEDLFGTAAGEGGGQ